MSTAPPRRRKARRPTGPTFAPPTPADVNPPRPAPADPARPGRVAAPYTDGAATVHPDPLEALDALVLGRTGSAGTTSPEPGGPVIPAGQAPAVGERLWPPGSGRASAASASHAPSGDGPPPSVAGGASARVGEAVDAGESEPPIGGRAAGRAAMAVDGGLVSWSGLRLVGVVTREATLPAVLGGTAAALRRAGASVVVTAACAPTTGAGPALPRAASLVRRLRAVGLDASAAGARCHVRLPGDPLTALAEAGRLIAASGETPVVVAATERGEELDQLLARADVLLLALPAADDQPLARLAADALGRLGPPVVALRVPTDPLGRAAATLGLRPLSPAVPPSAASRA